ncbi:unnamed protein product [Litomosoides sigmodontis]|uniref:ABC transporter domain-containing protein n=1 Tax=Litomosoides sigmodontis TaxID=42156 RepID=A0A3P6SJM2_LITSI|nr:unnamed protein product [Litomosoides sigmodontis]
MAMRLLEKNLNETAQDDFNCFRINILPVVPSIFFWLLLPIFCAQIYRIRVNGGVRSHPLPWTVLLIAKTALMICLLLNSLATLAISVHYSRSNGKVPPLIDLLHPTLTATATMGLFCCILTAQKNGMVTSGIMHITMILFTLCGFPEYLLGWQKIGNFMLMKDMDRARFALYQVWYPLVIIETLLFSFADLREPFLIEARKRLNLSPELDSSFLNRLLLWWFTSVQLLGARKTLVVDDLYQLNDGNTAAYLSAKWEKLWDFAIEDYRRKEKICKSTLENNKTSEHFKKGIELKPPSIVWRLFLMFRFEILSASAIKMLSDVMQLANPFFLNLLLNYISTGNHSSMEGLAYVIAMFVCAELRSFLLNYYFYLMMRVGIKIQTTLISAIYRKTLRLSNSARKTKTVGEIVNLMAIDVENFQYITPYVQQFWSCPFQTEQMRLKDERMKICNEILNGVKVIKLYAWEPPMEEVVEQIRCKELHLIQKVGLIRALIDTFNTSSPFLVAMLTFATYTLSSSAHILTPQTAFVSLTLFNQLRSPMAMIAYLMKQAVEAAVANRRIKSFLVADELNPLAIDRITDHSDAGNAVEMREAHLSWSVWGLETVLEVDCFAIPKRSLIAVVGRVGSGKSSLLSAILGEMKKVKGYIGVNGQMAVVSQQPWIQNSTLRENVKFGKRFDRKFYDQIMEACALVKDLVVLPNGDATEIGEKGINLSGGQKARVALARAVYQNRDIYLLDDPLSAVDSQVIGHNGLLRHKTRVLVTNNLAYLRKVDFVAYMQDGKLAAYGSYKKLREGSESFSKFIEACQCENEMGQESKEESETNNLELFNDSSSYLNENDESDSEDVNQESCDRLPMQPNMDEESSRVFHRQSVAKSLSEFSIGSTSHDKKEEEPKRITTEKVEVGRGLNSQFTDFVVYSISSNNVVIFWSNANDTATGDSEVSLGVRLGMYAAFGFAEGFCFFGAIVFLVISGLRASGNLHAPLLHRLLRSSMSFFDTTPIGRILNRLGKYFYVPTSRQIKRLESINRSPIYQHFEKTVQGLICIRAFEKVREFCKQMEEHLDCFIRCKYSNILSNRWLAVRLEFIGNCVVLFAALFAVLWQRWGAAVSAGIAGLNSRRELSSSDEEKCNKSLGKKILSTSISRDVDLLQITDALNFAVRYVSELEMNIVAVERVKEYDQTTSIEAEWRVDHFDSKNNWPSKGQISLVNYSTKYHSQLDLALRQLNAFIAPAEKIGKSSLALALFRIIEPVSGTIIIDGVDISVIGLHDLRSNLTIIPQDPVLFSGTIRFNLDPSHVYSDQEIWTALELSHLKTFVSGLAEGLQYLISEGGEDISVGQRQLICLTRALLRKSKILILDEATAAVDLATDLLIQETIRREFHTSTVLTIAHRLNTVIDYDRIIVLENGSIREFDSPRNLLANHSSIFFSMARDAQIVC